MKQPPLDPKQTQSSDCAHLFLAHAPGMLRCRLCGAMQQEEPTQTGVLFNGGRTPHTKRTK